jgi:hypothetical protein
VPPQVADATGCELAEVAQLTRQLTTMRDALARHTPAEAAH